MYSRRQTNLTGDTSLDEIMNEDNAPNCDYILRIIFLMNKFLLGKEGVSPIFFCKKDDTVMPIKVPSNLLDNEETKDELVLLIKTAVETFKPESFCLITEAWSYKVKDCADAEEANNIISDYKNGIENPKLVKEECVVFNYTEVNSDNSRSRWLGSMPIHRGLDKKISKFGSVKWIKEEDSKSISGTFVI